MSWATIQRLDEFSRPPLIPVRVRPDDPEVWCKLEFLQPSGSIKDRIANFILRKAIRHGDLEPGGLVIEASSGSTSIAMALVCAQLGLRFTAVMPEGVSDERVMIIKSYGGQVVATPKAEGMLGALAESERMACELSAFLPRQFANQDNPGAHRHGTAREIMCQVPDGKVDAVVSGVGTGGTLVGLFQGLCDFGCRVVPVAARPVSNDLNSDSDALCEMECCSFSRRIPGVVEGLSQIYREADLPGLMEIDVNDEAALETTRELIRMGFPVGPSSGLNYQAALEAIKRLGPGSRAVTVFPDRMERYFSTDLFRSYRTR